MRRRTKARFPTIHSRGVAVLLVALGLHGCADERHEPPAVVIVLVDQLRHDSAERHLSGVRDLAQQGVVLDGMRAAAPWTYPSVISLLSGLYPQQHGADGHPHANLLASFDASLPLLPAMLGDAGYAAAAFVANPFLGDFQPLHESFQHYDISFVGSQGNLRGAGALVWTERMFADSVNAAVLDHWDARGAAVEPEFTYVHYIDVHGPWEGAPWLDEDAPWNDAAELYALAIEAMDDAVLELYQAARARYGEDLLFVVTSDHGQALRDDELVGSGPPWRQTKASLHDFNLRIPFYVLPSGFVGPPRRSDVPCSNVDVLPTLLDWLGAGAPEHLPGQSLLPVLDGVANSHASPQYARMSAFGYRSDCVVHNGRKRVRWQDVDDGRVVATRTFDVETDPRELDPLALQPETEEPLAATLEALADTAGIAYPARFEDIDDEVLERLRHLGYLQSEDD